MSRTTFISTGSNTAVSTSAGTLYGIHIDNANGAVVLVQDSATGLGAAPNYNSTSITGLITRIGPTQNAGNVSVNMHGAHFNDGLTVAASSNASVTVFWSE